jgi:hypothetical protein
MRLWKIRPNCRPIHFLCKLKKSQIFCAISLIFTKIPNVMSHTVVQSGHPVCYFRSWVICQSPCTVGSPKLWCLDFWALLFSFFIKNIFFCNLQFQSSHKSQHFIVKTLLNPAGLEPRFLITCKLQAGMRQLNRARLLCLDRKPVSISDIFDNL